jgi:hypothetical protein
MHAIEIADRNGAAARRGRKCIKSANDVHRSGEQGAGSGESEVWNGGVWSGELNAAAGSLAV